MSYHPVAGDKIRFRNVAPWNRERIYRVDQVILTDQLQILGVVVSTIHAGERRHQLYDLVTFERFVPVKVGHGEQVESSPETSS